MQGIDHRDRRPARNEDAETGDEESDAAQEYAQAAAAAARTLAQLTEEEATALHWKNPFGLEQGPMRGEVYEALFALSCCSPAAILTGPALLAELETLPLQSSQPV